MFFRLDHSCKRTSDCMTQCDILLRHWICQWLRTKTCLSLKFYPIMWCKSWFYSWYFGFAFYLGVYHKCHIPLCHWVVTLSHITRTSAMARDIFFPEKSISIEYYNFMNNACMHFLCKTCKAKPARKPPPELWCYNSKSRKPVALDLDSRQPDAFELIAGCNWTSNRKQVALNQESFARNATPRISGAEKLQKSLSSTIHLKGKSL